ncbi:MAG: hypothetical protein K8H86_10075 [Ignavibacteriaceae bacterium]|nr:hypothetical protein [Ignavibacteriaceae bacterium]
MKNKPALFLSIVIFILSIGLQNTNAQVSVKLQQPPPYQLRATDLWNLTLTNATRNTLQVSLAGTLEESGAGVIIDGTSKPFSLSPGTKRITYNDVKSGSVNFKSGKWREAFTRTGNAPSGDYTICIYVKNEKGEELGSDCIQQTIEISGAPQLVSPADGEKITLGTLPTFTWMPIMPSNPKAEYTLKIVQILGKQSPEEAMNRNKVFFQGKGIKGTMFQYPLKEKKFEERKTYVWAVEVKLGETIIKSMMNSFTVGSNLIDIKIDSLKIACCEDGKNNFGIIVRNLLSTPVNITQIKINNINGVNSSIALNPSPALTFTIPGNSAHTFTGSFDCVDTSRTISVFVKAESPSDPDIINTESLTDTLNCLCNECLSLSVNFNNFAAALSGNAGNQFVITGDIVPSVPIYGMEVEMQSYSYTANPSPCTNGITNLEESGMFLNPGSTINGTPVQLFNETASGSSNTNNNASKIVKFSSTTALSGNIPINLIVGLPGPISGLDKECCNISYKVCFKIKLFLDKQSCNSCTFSHCFEFNNQ